jgi:hypothetical protein
MSEPHVAKTFRRRTERRNKIIPEPFSPTKKDAKPISLRIIAPLCAKFPTYLAKHLAFAIPRPSTGILARRDVLSASRLYSTAACRGDGSPLSMLAPPRNAPLTWVVAQFEFEHSEYQWVISQTETLLMLTSFAFSASLVSVLRKH